MRSGCEPYSLNPPMNTHMREVLSTSLCFLLLCLLSMDCPFLFASVDTETHQRPCLHGGKADFFHVTTSEHGSTSLRTVFPCRHGT